jgi:squalene cyclase
MATALTRRAVDYLIDRQTDQHLWYDFPTLGGGSTEWVSSYIGAALATETDRTAHESATRAWRRLARRRIWSAGWGYNRRVPSDADSTAWALCLADRVGTPTGLTCWRARRFLAKHQLSDGGVATYCDSGPVRAFTGLLGTSFEGWCGRSHPSVTAAAAGQFGGHDCDDSLDALRRSQTSAGHWRGYWWPDDSYPTALAAAALSRSGDPSDAVRVRRAAEWGAARIGSSGAARSDRLATPSAFATGLCLTLVCLGLRCMRTPNTADRAAVMPFTAGFGDENPNPDAARRLRAAGERAVAWLRHHQASDGSWRPSAAIRVPPPDLDSPDQYDRYERSRGRIGGVHFDRHRTFTTATNVAALRHAVEVEVGP